MTTRDESQCANGLVDIRTRVPNLMAGVETEPQKP